MRKYLKRLTPGRDTVHGMIGDGFLRRHFGSTLLHPKLWLLNRHAAAGGVAVGLFCGLIPGPFQMIGAALFAILLRINLPLALVTTLYTNPLTIVPLYVAAYSLGQWVIGDGHRGFVEPPEFVWRTPMDSLAAYGDWLMDLGPPLAFGLPALACILAAAGYAVVWAGWTLALLRYRARRRRRAGRRPDTDA